jgi:hypothetical protein
MRGRRAHSHTSQENLVKDSSSDVSPRESSSSALTNRRRQRRAHRSPDDQQYDNQAFAGDERPLPPPIERNDDEEEENIQQADRLVSNVTKQHHRILNEVQQKNQKSKRKTTTISDDIDHDKNDVVEQLQEQQKVLSKQVGSIDEDRALPIEPLPSSIGTARDGRSLEQLLEMARKSKTGKSFDDGQFNRLR